MIKTINYKNSWNNIIAYLEKDNVLNNFSSLFSSLKIEKITDNEVVFFSPVNNLHSYINKNILTDFETICRNFFENTNLNIIYIYYKNNSLKPNNSKTLTNFIVDSNNRLALAGVDSIFSSKNNYNPIYLHAKPGYGKSHLLNGIALKYKEVYPDKNICYLDSNIFIDQYKNSALTNNIPLWHNNILNSNLFILDNIHKLKNNTSVIDEFNILFDELYDRNIPIIISSDTIAENLDSFPDSLISKLQWDLKLEIYSDNKYKKNNYIQYCFNKNNKIVNEEIISYISENFNKNYRELNGIINTIIFYADTSSKPITIGLVNEIFKKKQHLNNISYTINNTDIIDIVCKYFKINVVSIKSKKRSRIIAYPRQIGMYLTKKHTNLSLEEIGKAFGGRDHSTVKHAIEKIKSLLNSDNKTKQIINNINTIIEDK